MSGGLTPCRQLRPSSRREHVKASKRTMLDPIISTIIVVYAMVSSIITVLYKFWLWVHRTSIYGPIIELHVLLLFQACMCLMMLLLYLLLLHVLGTLWLLVHRMSVYAHKRRLCYATDY